MPVKTPGRNRANVLVGAPDVKASGGFLIGPVAENSELFPTDAKTALKDQLGLKPGGYISKEGVVKTVNRDTEKIEDWNGDTVIILQTSHSVELKLTVLEAANAYLLKHLFGDANVQVDTEGKNITIKDNAEEMPHFSLDFEIKGSATSKIRLFAADGQVTGVGDVSFVRSDVVKYELTIECFADVDDNKLYQFIYREDGENKPAVTPQPGGGGAVTPGPVSPQPQPATSQPPNPQPATVEVKKKIDIPDDATGGTWALTIGSERLTDIAFNATPTTLRSKLQGVAGIQDVIVRREGSNDFIVEFSAATAVEVTADGAGLTGGATTTITVTDAA
mgnify:CR=1 FL=1